MFFVGLKIQLNFELTEEKIISNSRKAQGAKKLEGCTLDRISILQSINSPRRSELHAGNPKNF